MYGLVGYCRIGCGAIRFCREWSGKVMCKKQKIKLLMNHIPN